MEIELGLFVELDFAVEIELGIFVDLGIVFEVGLGILVQVEVRMKLIYSLYWLRSF